MPPSRLPTAAGRLSNSNTNPKGRVFPEARPFFVHTRGELGVRSEELFVVIAIQTDPEMVTTQVVPDSESTCDTAVCVVSFNTNLSNLTNRAG